MKEKRQVVITGAGIASPAGYSIDDNADAWWQGFHNFTEITRFSTSGSSVKFAGQCPKPETKKLPNRKVQKILRRKDVISLLTTIAAAEAAGVQDGQVDPERFGMYVGAPSTQVGDLTPYFTIVAQCADLSSGRFDSLRFGRELMDLVNPLVVLQTLMNNGLCFGTMTLDIRGVNANYMDFQVAGLRAVGEAFRSIQDNRADIVIAGGISGPIEPFQLAEGVRSGYLAKTNNTTNPSKTVRPYDQNRLGAILSEGSVYLVLEEEQHAINRGVPIWGRIDGFCLVADGIFNMMDETESPGLVRSLEGATREAKIKKQELGMIVGHGNGSRSADRAESWAYANFLSDRAKDVPVTSPKAAIGDLCEAGGVLGTLLALDALKRKEVPATHNFSQGDDQSRLLSISGDSQRLRCPTAAITSRNFLGLCATLVVSES